MSSESRLRDRWREGQVALNFWLATASLPIVELLPPLGFDSVVLDMQHGLIEPSDLYVASAAPAGADLTLIVRVPWNEPGALMKALDAGVGAVICPMVNTAEEARTFVDACRYPPLGYRSFGAYRANLVESIPEQANRTIITIAQIETIGALQQVDAIASTQGLDALCIGSVDLSISAGGPPLFDHTDAAACERHMRIISAAHAAGIKVGLLATLDQLPTVRSWALDWISIADDASLIIDGGTHAIAVARRSLAADS
jgi:4-hydroxy-2-oxoheptanedioate aldolase